MTTIDPKHLIAAALHSAGGTMTLDQLLALFDCADMDKNTIRKHLDELQEDFQEGPLALVEVATGYRIQVKQEYADSLQLLADKKPPRYSRSLLETLALILYRQPITRGEIEDVRGVAVSTHTIKTLIDRKWVRVIGHKEVPGKPALYGSTKAVLDYFGLKSLAELPPLDELVDLEEIGSKLNEQLSLNVEGELPIGQEDTQAETEEESESEAESESGEPDRLSGMDAIDAALEAINEMDDVAIGFPEEEESVEEEVVAKSSDENAEEQIETSSATDKNAALVTE